MKLISLNAKPAFTLGKARAADKAPEQFSLGGKAKTEVKVTLTGRLRAADVKAGDEWKPGAYGSLPVYAGKVTSKSGVIYIAVVVAGGLRGVLFKTKKEGSEVLYSGILEDGKGNEFPIFAREAEHEGSKFLSVSAGEAVPADKARGKAKTGTDAAVRGRPAQNTTASTFEDEDIPF